MEEEIIAALEALMQANGRWLIHKEIVTFDMGLERFGMELLALLLGLHVLRPWRRRLLHCVVHFRRRRHLVFDQSCHDDSFQPQRRVPMLRL